MSEDEQPEEQEPKKGSKLPILLGIILAIVGGGAGFYLTWSGTILGAPEEVVAEEEPEEGLPDLEYISMDQLVISLPPSSRSKHLVFRGSLEVPSSYKADVEKLLPRITDVMNSYLRALDPGDFEAPAALVAIRAQLLQRIKIIVGQKRVNDLLVLEFVLN